MTELLLPAIGMLTMVAIPLSTFNLGLKTGRPYLIRLLERPATLARFFLATFVVMPALALWLAVATPVPLPVWGGLLLMSISPPGLGLPQKSLKLTGDSEIGLAWQTLAILVSVVTIPLSLVVIEAVIARSLWFDLPQVLQKIGAVYLIPIAAGFIGRARWPVPALALSGIVGPVAVGAQLLMVVLLVIVAAPVVISVGIISLLVVMGFVACAIAVGHLAGGPDPEWRPVLAAGLALRWLSPALILLEVNQLAQAIVATILTYLFVGALLMALYERWLKRSRPQSEAAAMEAPG